MQCCVTCRTVYSLLYVSWCLCSLNRQILCTRLMYVSATCRFDELQGSGIAKDGPCRNSKILRNSGEVAVLIPPLVARWSMDSCGCYKLVIRFCWAVLNSGGMVSASCLTYLACNCMEAISTVEVMHQVQQPIIAQHSNTQTATRCCM